MKHYNWMTAEEAEKELSEGDIIWTLIPTGWDFCEESYVVPAMITIEGDYKKVCFLGDPEFMYFLNDFKYCRALMPEVPSE